MDEENWATVDFNVLLDGCLVSVVFIASLESSVKESPSKSVEPPACSFKHGPVDVEHHCTDDGFSNISEPESVKVSNLSFKDSTQETELFSEVSIDQEQKHSSVEELDNENTIGNQLSLLRFSVLTKIDDKLDDDKSEYIVDTDNHVLNSIACSETDPVV